MTEQAAQRDWKHHMRENVSNWLLGPHRNCLHANGLMLFGNPYQFQRDAFLRHFSAVESMGQFHNAIHNGKPVTFCYPLFGGPMTAMYTEVMLDNGVRNIIACGYVGGIAPEADIGGYGLVTAAAGLDGTCHSYGMGRRDIPAAEGIVNALQEVVKARGVACHSAPIASIDALLLEDDRMIGDLRSKGYGFIDLETACMFALAQDRNASMAALHIVTDNPTRKVIDAAASHEASFNEQVQIALSVLTKL